MFNDFKNVFPNSIPSYDSQSDSNWYGVNGYGSMPPTPFASYGYESSTPSTGYFQPLQDITVNQTSYTLDPLSNSWVYEIANNKGKVKKQPLTEGFSIICSHKNYSFNHELKYVIIIYQVKEQTHTVVMPEKDFNSDRFHNYLKQIFRYPGCTKSAFNALVSFLLQTSPSKSITLYPHQGWIELNDGSITFASNPNVPYIPHTFFSPSIIRRIITPSFLPKEEIIAKWLDIFSKSPVLSLLGYYRTGSLFQYFSRLFNLNVGQFLLIEPSKGFTESQIEAALATTDIKNFPSVSLDAGAEKILKEIEETYDGVTVFTDSSFADEINKISSGLKAIIQTLKQKSSTKGNGLVAVISNNATYLAAKLAPENFLAIRTDNITLEADAYKISEVASLMDSLIIKTISENIPKIQDFFAINIPHIRNFVSKNNHGETLNTVILLYVVESFFRHFMEFTLCDYDSINNMMSSINMQGNAIVNTSHAIENDFSSVLSERIRSKTLIPFPKHRNMRFENNGGSFILDGDRMLIPSEIIRELLHNMKTTNSLDSLMNALKCTDSLNYTDGNTHPTEIHDSNGKHLRLYLYDVSTQILDSDVLYTLQNLEADDFLFSNKEKTQKEFMGIVNDGRGNTAGKKICYTDEENGHFYITGQSGFGKTYLLCQLIAKCHNLGHKVIIFDSSDSFTHDALVKNLSTNYVDLYVNIYDMDKEQIPVNLFDIDRFTKLPIQKKQLLGILQAGVSELSPTQLNTLRSIISDVISSTDKYESISHHSIISEINNRLNDNPDATITSLFNRFEPLFEDIDGCGMANRTWLELFRISRKINIIHTDSSATESGNQLFDMMLATLLKYQSENPQIPLDIFIDEIQNQNLSKVSPICKIMKEGRKKHISFFGATQDFYPSNTELGSVMGKAGTQIFLRPTPNSKNAVAAELGYKKNDLSRFDIMDRGDIIVKGNLYSKRYRRNIPTILSGHVDDYPKIPDTYYGNAL